MNETSQVVHTKEMHVRVAWSVWFAAFAMFWSSRHFAFVDYDDLVIMLDRPRVFSGVSLGNLLWAFSTLHADFAYWMPLTWFSHQLDCQLFGINAGAHHLTNVLFHATNSVLLFRVMHKLTDRLWQSACVTLLFAWHPLHVESVAWVAERKSLVCSLFWMLTCLAYIRYVASRTWQNYLLVFGGSLGALMGKPMAVTLPFSLLLLDYWPLTRWRDGERPGAMLWKRWGWLVVEKTPLFALSLIGSVLTYVAQSQAGAVKANVGFQFRIENALVACWLYVQRTFWPTDLIPIYERHPWSYGIVIWAVFFLCFVSVLCFRLSWRHPYLLMGWLWYLGNLIPSIGLIPIGAHAMADRYTYIPLIGVFIIIVWGASDALNAIGLSSPCRKYVASICCAVAFVTLGCCTLRQIGIWKDGVTLFARAVKVAPWSAKAHYLFGANLLYTTNYGEALKQAQEARRLDSTSTESLVLIANVLRRTGRFAEAKSFYELALAEKADSKQALAGLAYLLSTAEDADLRSGPLAVTLASRLCNLTENRYPRYLSVLACAFAESGQFEKAIHTAEQGLATARKIGDVRWAHKLEDEIWLFEKKKPFRASQPLARMSAPE